MNTTEIQETINQAIPTAAAELHTGESGMTVILVQPAALVDVVRHLRDELNFDYLATLAGIDTGENLAVAYQLRSLKRKIECTVKVVLDREKPEVPSISELYGAADWFEREVFDLFGVQFPGHPDMRRLLMPDDWEGYPLRKDYQEQPEYHGISTTRPDPLDLLDPEEEVAESKEGSGS
jgi:NADH-quinone oxidoreductase subunit C